MLLLSSDFSARLQSRISESTITDKPTPPQGPMDVTNLEKDSATISWRPPLDDGGVELTKYLIEKYEMSSMTWTKIAEVEPLVTTYSVQSLQMSDEYLFRVYAQNSIGKSEPLESKNVSLKASFKVPSPPRAPLEVSGMSATSFTISWQASASDGGSSIIEYIVEMKESNRRVFKKLGATKGAVTNFAVNYLEKDQGYNFKITARNAVGLSEPFLPEDTITAGARITTPSPPRNLEISDTTTKSATITWDAPENTGGTELTGYIIEKKYEYMPNWERAATLEPSVHKFTFENLREKTKYVFRVMAENSVGVSNPAVTRTLDLFTYATVPSPPTAPLEIRTIGPNAIVIEWGIPESDGGSPLLGYNIAIRDTRKTMWMEVGRVAVPTQKFTIRDLQEDHEYLIRVFARNEIGLSDPLDSDEPFRVLPSTDADAEEFKEVTDREPTSYSTETTTSWLRDNSMDADIHSYSRGKLLQKNEYFFKIWCFAEDLFK
uniref:Fibronectin type-III domain-containing protein n=1 Tax=Photinus pyralis TaxID=7054 RepID=A0A1Y1MXQ4_PHOPY